MTTPQTVAGAIRARLIQVFPDLQVFRNEAPQGTQTPLVIITDGLNVQGEDLGDDLLLTEQVQVDLYIDYAQVTNWADQIHAALHRAPISVPGSQIHRCLVTERINQPADAGNEDGVERITFTVLVRRRMSATEYGNLPIQPTPTLLEIHEAQTTNVHGIANTAELETQTGAQAKADNALAAANAYTDAALEDINVPDLSLYETIVGAQAKADAAEAAAIVASNAYTDQEVVELTNGTTDFEAAQFNTATPGTSAVGRLTWNQTDGTLDLGLIGGNVTLQVGQETVQRINNRTGSAFTDGQVVYVNGSQGNRLTAALALATNDMLSARTFGIVTEPIADNQSGFVTTSGLVRNIDTSALPEGAAVYLSPTVPGGLTATRPLAPNHGVLVGWCVRQHATVGSIFVHVQNGFELGELHNVLTNGTLNGQVLAYEASTGLWKPVNPGDPAGTAAAAVAAHEGAVDPHGDRAYADSLAPNYAPATGIDPTAITGTAVITTDPRLSDSRTPTAHAASHADGGSDEIALAPAQITQDGATTGQVLAWSGSQWAPATPSAGATGGTYQGPWSAGSTYSNYGMVTYDGSMYAATGTPAAGTAPAVTAATFNSNLTSADWTRLNVAALASPAITLVNNTTNTLAQAYNSSSTLSLSARSTSTVRVTQTVDLSMIGTADGIHVGFFTSAFTPTAGSVWWAQTAAISVFFDIFNGRIGLVTNGALQQQVTNPSLRTGTSSVFDQYRLEWTFTSTNTNVTVYRNNTQVASFTFTLNSGLTSVRDGLAGTTGGSAGTFRAQNYSRTWTPIVNTGWQRLFTLP